MIVRISICVKMADDAFGDALFEEFDREDAPTDRVLMAKISKELLPKSYNRKDNSRADIDDPEDKFNGTENEVGDNIRSEAQAGESETESDRMSRHAPSSENLSRAESSQLETENILYMSMMFESCKD